MWLNNSSFSNLIVNTQKDKTAWVPPGKQFEDLVVRPRPLRTGVPGPSFSPSNLPAESTRTRYRSPHCAVRKSEAKGSQGTLVLSILLSWILRTLTFHVSTIWLGGLPCTDYPRRSGVAELNLTCPPGPLPRHALLQGEPKGSSPPLGGDPSRAPPCSPCARRAGCGAGEQQASRSSWQGDCRPCNHTFHSLGQSLLS